MKKKIFLSKAEKKMLAATLAKKFGVSRTTAWRAKKSGWLVPAYHSKEVAISFAGTSVPSEEIIENARIGVFAFLKRTIAGNFSVEIAPFSTDDLVHEAVKRLYELTGHERFSNRGWRINVAWLAARDFLQTHVWKHWRVDGEDERELPENPDPKQFGDNRMLMTELRLQLGEKNWRLLWDWARGKNSITREIDNIISRAKEVLHGNKNFCWDSSVAAAA